MTSVINEKFTTMQIGSVLTVNARKVGEVNEMFPFGLHYRMSAFQNMGYVSR